MSENSNNFKFIGITDELKASFKDLLSKFNVTPVIAPVNPNPNPTPEPKKFGEAVAKDGTVLKWEGDAPLSAGLALLVIDPANPEGFLPAPDGEIELQDGTIVVIEGGLVKEVKGVAPVAPVAPAPTSDMTAQFAKIETELSEVKAQFSAVSKEKTDLESKFTSEIESLKATIEASNKITKEMFELFGKAMDTPTADPVEVPNKGLSKADKLIQKLK